MEVYGTSKKFLNELDDFKTPLTDMFLEVLSLSDVGNLLYAKKVSNSDKHDIILQTSA